MPRHAGPSSPRKPAPNLTDFQGNKEGNGGEGGIRTPDTLTGMSDFESGAFNRALPPLRFGCRPTHARRTRNRAACGIAEGAVAEAAASKQRIGTTKYSLPVEPPRWQRRTRYPEYESLLCSACPTGPPNSKT